LAKVRGVKFGQLQVVIGKDGKRHKERQYCYGYKDQVSLNANTGLVASVIPGHANDYDGHKLKSWWQRT